MSLMTRIRGTSTAEAGRELGWEPRYPGYREGFRRGRGERTQAASTSGELAS